MSTRKTKNNTTSVPLFSPALKETVRRLRHKEPELDDLLKRENENHKPRKRHPGAQPTPSPGSTQFTGRSGPLVRQWAIIRHLSQHLSGCQVQELSRILNTRSRTIYRDLEALKRAGFPLMRHQQKDHTAFWTIGPWWRDDFHEESEEKGQEKVKKTSKTPRRAR
jgi:hypothetical protein